MVYIRRATMKDLFGIRHCHSLCHSKNELFIYFMEHLVKWPSLQYVAEDSNGSTIVGFVLASMDPDCCYCDEDHGYISSVCVLPSHRRRGIATKLMNLVHKVIENEFRAYDVTVQERASNNPAMALFIRKFGYKIAHIDTMYYPDEDDRFDLTKLFKGTSFCSASYRTVPDESEVRVTETDELPEEAGEGPSSSGYYH